jgi:hypothetical protein
VRHKIAGRVRGLARLRGLELGQAFRLREAAGGAGRDGKGGDPGSAILAGDYVKRGNRSQFSLQQLGSDHTFSEEICSGRAMDPMGHEN